MAGVLRGDGLGVVYIGVQLEQLVAQYTDLLQIPFTHSLRQLREIAQPAYNFVGVDETPTLAVGGVRNGLVSCESARFGLLLAPALTMWHPSTADDVNQGVILPQRYQRHHVVSAFPGGCLSQRAARGLLEHRYASIPGHRFLLVFGDF